MCGQLISGKKDEGHRFEVRLSQIIDIEEVVRVVRYFTIRRTDEAKHH
jgi:hypothetical protein